MSLALKIILGVAAAAALLFGFDRLALAMERRGWIYYRKKKPSRTSLGNAFLTVQSILEPGTEKVVEVRLERKSEQDSGDGPKAGGRPRSRKARRKKAQAPRPPSKKDQRRGGVK